MERYQKIVLEAPEGMHYTTSQGENGELILRLIPNEEVVEKNMEKAIYFTHITADDREKVKQWLAKQKETKNRERGFLERVKKAVQVVNYDYWIANLEPSVNRGKIYYAKGEKVGVGVSCYQYKQMAEAYAPERCSRLAELHELFIWYALRIVNGLWTLDYVANDSSSAGNYGNAPGSTGFWEKTGARECGGYRDGQGNTYKIVAVKDGFALVGGDYHCHGNYLPVETVRYVNFPYNIHYSASGVLVLTK